MTALPLTLPSVQDLNSIEQASKMRRRINLREDQYCSIAAVSTQMPERRKWKRRLLINHPKRLAESDEFPVVA